MPSSQQQRESPLSLSLSLSERGRAPTGKLNIVTSLASLSQPQNAAPHTSPATVGSTAKPLISTESEQEQQGRDRDRDHDHDATDPEPESEHGRALTSTSPTATATRNNNANACFLDDPTPIDIDADSNMTDQHASDTPRDSHDLSLSPRDVTRDSLVNNMLLSLDQLSLGLGQVGTGSSHGGSSLTYDDPRAWANDVAGCSGSSSGRANGHDSSQRHQYSYSSDDSSRTSTQIARGRRSNSTSNFQGTFPRLNSLREPTHRAQPGAPRALHSRGRRSSTKSSSSSASIDTGYNPRWTRSGFRRSASFDYGPPQTPSRPHPHTQTHTQTQTQAQAQTLTQSLTRTLQQQLNAPMVSPFRVEFPGNLTAEDYLSAAPTPTVPAGPRRVPSAMSIPPPPPEPVDMPMLERKRSISRSIKSSSGRSKRGVTPQPPAPAMSLNDFDSAPAPNVSFGKSKADPPAGQFGNAPAQPKERQGFFRRVFGSSRNSSASNGVADPQQQNTSQSGATTVTPSRDTSSSHSQPVLQKKPSSFFRRRKKSVADEAPPLPGDVPPIPSLADSTLQVENDTLDSRISPASSLRNVMKPYLRENTTRNSPLGDVTNTAVGWGEEPEGQREYQREFSPDYDPSPNAKIRTVVSDADPEQLSRTLKSKACDDGSNSFLDLEGGSDNDDSPVRLKKKRSVNRKENGAGVSSSPALHKSRDPNGTIRASKKSPYNLDHADLDDEQPMRPKLALRIDGTRATSFASGSTETDYKTAPSAPPSVRIEGASDHSPNVLGALESMKTRGFDEPEFIIGEPTEDDRQKAQRIYDGIEDFIPKDKAASWMGEEGPVRQRTLQAYIELYDFADQSILSALRKVCGRLVLRGETQQVDRILVAFSKRWCQCNPNHGFKATDVIHTICYSIMLLNTDLHLADIEQKMTRSQFVRNTLTTITQAVVESVPDAFERPSILPDKNSLHSGDNTRTSVEQDRRTFRNSFRPPPRTDTQSSDVHDDCGPLVKAPFHGSMKAWEEQVEVGLKGIYASIRDDRLPLFGAEPERHLTTAPSQSSLSVIGMLKRSPSVLSKTPSESQISTRGRIADSGRNNAARWTSKSRSRPGFGRNGFSSSRTSFDDGNSLWSPALSSATWSRYSLGRTQGSMSQDSFGSAMPRGDYQQSIGFANALSQAIIRDEDAIGHDSVSIMSTDVPASQLLEDESLELSGPPWVKEGRVMYKHHLDGVGKRAKDRNWTEVFAVIQRGQMSLFSFNASKSMRHKSRSRNAGKPNAPVGGGNWQDNAVNLGTFNLRLTLASSLPAPGYSRARPYVWALSLPTGAVHLFQGGTPEIIKEFVNTANYWSARLSTHPLVGGISNVEYGWSDAIVNNSLVTAVNESCTSLVSGRTSRPGSSTAHVRKSSMQSGSFQTTSFDQGSGAFTNNSGRGKLPGDRINISGWTPPTQSMRPCNLPEVEQLDTLAAYVKSIEDELQAHNQLRSPMLLAFTPRGQNAGKAMANWERKSAYLLREIVKFRTYVDTLQQAETRKREIHKERDLARRAARGELSDGEMDVSGTEEGDETLRP